MEQMQLRSFANKLAGTLSGGNKRESRHLVNKQQLVEKMHVGASDSDVVRWLADRQAVGWNRDGRLAEGAMSKPTVLSPCLPVLVLLAPTWGIVTYSIDFNVQR